MYKHRKKIFLLLLLLTLAGIYILGSAPVTPLLDTAMPTVPQYGDSLDTYIERRERKHNLKSGNEAHIVWFDKEKKRTPYSVVYLHGFSASYNEGSPVHTQFAKKFGCNLYLSRLADHGIDTTDQLLYFTVDRLWNSAKEALEIGQAIGDKVILMSTSTGGSMALMLAAAYPKNVHALINMSPNIAINDRFAFLLNNSWGLQIARIVMDSKYMKKQQTPEQSKYWYSEYRLEATTQLEELLERKMNRETFRKVKQPSLTLYYYRDEEHQDGVVKVSAILKMHSELATPDTLKAAVPIPDAETHAIGSYLTSKDTNTVIEAMSRFAQKQLGMLPVP